MGGQRHWDCDTDRATEKETKEQKHRIIHQSSHCPIGVAQNTMGPPGLVQNGSGMAVMGHQNIMESPEYHGSIGWVHGDN